MKKLFLLTLIFFLPTSAFAFLSIQDYQKDMGSNNEVAKILHKAVISGVGNGFLWANVELVSKGEAPLYCQPMNLTLTMENYVQILDDSIKEYKKRSGPLYDPNMAIDLLLLEGLKRTFPCNKN